jgi:hypothetical protein
MVRILVACSLVAPVLTDAWRPAEAVRVPRTLADATILGVGTVNPVFPIDFVGVQWDGTGEDGAIRLRHHGRWGPWRDLLEDGIDAPSGFASALVSGGDADAYQVRVPRNAARPRAVAINTTDGPEVPVLRRPAGAAEAAVDVTTRAEWGADETLRGDAAGVEVWPPEYHPVQKMTVHHTVTANGDPDPPATVRAIYRYHAVDRGWGDIGYQYLVDESGRVYEGRWSGTDGDPAHDGAGNGVTAAHVAGYNSANLGIAMVGTFSEQPPTSSAQRSLESLLADLARRHGIDPQGSGPYTNPATGATWDGPNVAAHRDWAPTECPGEALYALLPRIRTNAALLSLIPLSAPVP